MRGAMAIGSLAAGLLLPACTDDSLIDGIFSEAEWAKISRFTPLPMPPPASPTNAVSDDPRAARLGQRLWFEKRYAGPIREGSVAEGGLGEIGEVQKVSCADCHHPSHWFSDPRPMNKTSLGTARTGRNAPSMVNAVYYDWGNWAGSHDQFWKQGANSPESLDNFNSNRVRYARVIYEYYRNDYNELFDPDIDEALAPGDTSRFPLDAKPKKEGEPDGAWEMMDEADRHIVNTVMANCGKSLEAYERLLVSQNAPFDRYVDGERSALTARAKRGLKLFVGKAACDACHQGTTFTDQDFHNTGVPQTMPFDEGRFKDAPRLDNMFNGAGVFSDDPIAGQAKLNSIDRAPTDAMKGQFRTKSLRHVSETGPYFHDGSMPTLADVVRFYNGGGGVDGTYPGVKDERIVPLNLTEAELLDLVAFLEALTGEKVPEDLTHDTSATMPASLHGTYIAVD